MYSWCIPLGCIELSYIPLLMPWCLVLKVDDFLPLLGLWKIDNDNVFPSIPSLSVFYLFVVLTNAQFGQPQELHKLLTRKNPTEPKQTYNIN